MTHQLLQNYWNIDVSDLFTFNSSSITVEVIISNYLNHFHTQRLDHHFFFTIGVLMIGITYVCTTP